MTPCWRSQSLSAARRSGLSEAERLWLEHHLDTCAECRAQAQLLDHMASEVDAGSARIVLSDRALGRMVSTALQQGLRGQDTPVSSKRLRLWPIYFATGLVATAALVLLVVRNQAAPPKTVARTPSAATAPTAIAEAPSAPTAEPNSPVQPVAATTTLVAGRENDLRIATLSLSSDGEATWNDNTRVVELEHGRADLRVEPTGPHPLRVRTRQFQVVVVGTEFSVTPASVEVIHGTVQVLDLDGKPLVEALSTGGRWQLRHTPPKAAPGDSAQLLLAHARAALADGESRLARQLVDKALATRPTRALRAEGETLLAEVALVDGDAKLAAERYGDLAERYHDLPAGETALFAAASASARAGRTQDAQALARRYLARYPSGRLRSDAQALLSRLSHP